MSAAAGVYTTAKAAPSVVDANAAALCVRVIINDENWTFIERRVRLSEM